MTARKQLAAAALVCMVLFAGCTGSGGSATDQSATQAVTSAESADVADSSVADAETSTEADAAGSEAQDDTFVSMGELEVLEDDEVDEDTMEALDEQYSDFTDADISLPIIP